MSPAFQSLIDRHLASAFARQLALADYLGDRSWSVSISEGRATFGDDLTHPIQLLGTEAEGDFSWLWAWANEASNLPPAVLEACQMIKQFGVDHDVPELTEANFSLEIANGHLISLVASGLMQTYCYYRGPYEGGALFFLVGDLPEELTSPVRVERATTVITQVISTFDLDHREMAQHFLQDQQFELESDGGGIVATRGKDSVQIEFDDQNRITKVESIAKPE